MMLIRKKVLGSLEKAYAVQIMKVNGKLNYLVASEGQNPCLSFQDETWEKSVVWDGPGGTMSIIPVPGRKNEFIASQKFFPTFNAKESLIVHAKCDEGGKWEITPIMTIPFLHRFDVFSLDGKLYFIGCTLCEDKEFKDDWSKPGKVYIGKFSEKICEPFKIKPILEGITKNHGFCRGSWNGKDAFLVSGVEGVFVIYIPSNGDMEFRIQKILDHEVSDIATFDIDGDGMEELATIEPFHGNKGKIYKKINEKLVPVYQHEYEFGHVVWGGKILNKPSFIIGGRKGNRELVLFQMDEETGEITETLLDNTGGPSNIAVVNKENSDVILAANREISEIAIYEIKKLEKGVENIENQ